MTNKSHTPAPWHIIDGTICDNYGQDILSPVLFDAFPDEHQANARLIAAAHDLLAMLKRVFKVMPSRMEEGGQLLEGEIAALINKAEGQ